MLCSEPPHDARLPEVERLGGAVLADARVVVPAAEVDVVDERHLGENRGQVLLDDGWRWVGLDVDERPAAGLVQPPQSGDALGVRRSARLPLAAEVLVQRDQADAMRVVAREAPAIGELRGQPALGQQRAPDPGAIQPLDDGERHFLDLRVVDHERVGRQAQVHVGREYPLPRQLAVEEREGVPDDSRAAPLGVVSDAPMMPGHQKRVAGVAAAVAAAQDVIDAVKPETTLVEQALALDGLEWHSGSVAHGLHSVGRPRCFARGRRRPLAQFPGGIWTCRVRLADTRRRGRVRW